MGMKKPILLTAFEPFGGRSYNPALDVMKALPSAVAGRRLYKAAMPVSGRTVGARLGVLMEEYEPGLIVSLGLAAGEASVRVERFALNIMDYRIKDNSGYAPEGKKIYADGPAAYFVNTDPARAAAAIRKAGLPAYVSNHAGAYVCNHLMYEAMHAINTCGLDTKYSFIHLPITTEMALGEKQGKTLAPSLPLAMLVKAVLAAIKAL